MEDPNAGQDDANEIFGQNWIEVVLWVMALGRPLPLTCVKALSLLILSPRLLYSGNPPYALWHSPYGVLALAPVGISGTTSHKDF